MDEFLSTVANYIYSYKEYPTKSEYIHIAEQIVKQYPFLLNDGSYVSTEYRVHIYVTKFWKPTISTHK